MYVNIKFARPIIETQRQLHSDRGNMGSIVENIEERKEASPSSHVNCGTGGVRNGTETK